MPMWQAGYSKWQAFISAFLSFSLQQKSTRDLEELSEMSGETLGDMAFNVVVKALSANVKTWKVVL